MCLGEHICRSLPLNTVIALSGDLGCGKTTLVKGMARALGIDPKKVNSPSYVLIKEYNVKKGNLFHLDLYRLEGVKEISLLGIEEYFNQKGLLIIEWAEKAKDLLPGEYVKIKIKALSEYRRRFSLSAEGQKCRALIKSINGLVRQKKKGA